jgi:hypothetical protein
MHSQLRRKRRLMIEVLSQAGPSAKTVDEFVTMLFGEMIFDESEVA